MYKKLIRQDWRMVEHSFGLLPNVDPKAMVRLTQQTDSTCIFVHDSGTEGALV